MSKKPAVVPEEADESPDLPDSDDNSPGSRQGPQASGAAPPTLPRSNSGGIGTSTLRGHGPGRGGLFPAANGGPVSERDKQGGSFMGILKRNKKGDLDGKIQRPEYAESAARRDTQLERSPGQLRDMRGDRPTSPKLQKRNSLAREGSWPLPEIGGGAGDRRPSSAGNAGGGGGGGVRSASGLSRPILQARRSTHLGLPGIEEQGAGDEGAAPKKRKKFPGLRRMFGLGD